MDKKVNLSFILAVGLMLFSFFFGAGNLIFPPVLGQLAGEHTFLATLGFCISGVGLPLLGIIAMTSNRYKGPDDAGSAVSPMYARIVMVLCALSIGPFFAIPRTAATSFNAGIMLLINPDYEFAGMVVYSVIFFAIAYWMAVHPSKIIDVLGKAMTPVLLIGLVMLLGAAFFGINDLNVASQGAYVTQPLTKGILEGYNTMDLLCAMLFGSATIAVIETQGFVSEKDFLKITLYAGFIAAFFLGIVYAALAYVGLVSVGTVGLIDNGALLLNKICDYYYGSGGAIILAVVFFLACIT
ncbi:MAG: branched-chain amino acid transport system II carrier protein, partial [Phascolarctobacterium sp.]|nr:branched-chain amino acid transport system II carrier protein [Candidatus Phascolarctobacterium caballi]